MRKIITLSILLLFNNFLNAQIAAGDIAFIGYNTDSPDGFAFVTLAALPGNSEIKFTDAGVGASGWLTSTEGHLSFTAPAGGIPIGKVFYIAVSGSSVSLTNPSGVTATAAHITGSSSYFAGDQVLAYTFAGAGVPASAYTSGVNFIAGVHGDDGQGSPSAFDATTKWSNTSGTGSARSMLPPGLTNGTNCVALFPAGTWTGTGAGGTSEFDNNKYTGTLTGTATAIRAAINDHTNWTHDDGSAIAIAPTDFATPNITPSTPSTAPTVTTTAANSITDTSATLAGNVTADGGAAVSERGIVYSTTDTTPTIAEGATKNTNGAGIGVFSEPITGLSLGTQYYYNAYAINSVGTSYGTASSFTTTGKRWLGGTTNWVTANNWSPNGMPTATDNIVIPNIATKPIVGSSTNAVAKDINIDASSSLTIESGGTLIIDGTATVNGDFIYKVNVPDDKWHLISSPVKDEQYNDTWNTANGIETNLPNEAVAHYINTSDANGDWVYYQHNVSGSITFGTGIGYSMKNSSGTGGNYTFTGKFPTLPINPTITVSDLGTPASENRWNLIGNPFPAYLDIASFLTANATPLTDTHESVYVWNAGTSKYEPLTTGQIHPGQGFFVNSNIASTSVTLTKAMQNLQTSATFYRTSNPKISLMISDGSKTKATEINYLANKTIGLDPRFDIGTFTGQASSFNLYTHLISNSEGVSFTRQALPNTNYENMIVPVGLNVNAGLEITFTADALNLPTDIKVFLEDKETNTFTRLDEVNSSYKITPATTLNGIGRFYLHTSQNALSIKDIALENVSIYKADATTLRIVGLQNSKINIKIFTILGKQVFNTSFTTKGVKDISLPKLTSGIYVVQLQTDNGKLNKKIILE